MTANEIIAKLLDQHKITGKEAVILIQECNKQETKIIHQYEPYRWNYPYTYYTTASITQDDNSITTNCSID